MAAINEVSIGFAKESVYGTPVTVTRWAEFLSGTDSLDITPNRISGEGLRSGGKVRRSSRRVTLGKSGSGGFGVELFSKGLGVLFENALGTGASTLVAGTTYQQNFTLSGSPAPTLTVQKGVVDSTGTTRAHTFTSATCKSFAIECDNNAIAKATFDYHLRDMATATAYATPSYASGGSLFHFGNGAVTIGGTVTAPTTTALASGGTAVTNILGIKLNVDRGLSNPQPAFGNTGLDRQPIVGLTTITGSLEVEYSDNVLRDAVLADTELAIVATFTSTESLSTGYAQFQVYLPAVRFTGNMPQATGELPTLTVEFEAFDDGTHEPVVVAIRTADTAL